MENVERLEAVIWKKIRETQAQGTKVRNGAIAGILGGARGQYQHYYTDTPCCLMGALGVIAPLPMCEDDRKDFYTRALAPVAERLEVTIEELVILEAGFEGWCSALVKRYNGFDLSLDCQDHELYQLGRRVAQRLFAEEQAAA